MLKKTKVKLDLILDHSVLEFLEQQMGGGVATAFTRYAEANNKYLSNYNNYKPTSFIKHLDDYNLCGHAMSRPLPTGNFKFWNPNKIKSILKQLQDNLYQPESNVGRAFEVDIDYPKEIHE